MTETNYTPAQLEAWAGLGPWEWCENWLYVANYNEHPGPVLWYTANDDGVHVKPDDAALIAAAPDLARLVLEKEKEIARLKERARILHLELHAAAQDMGSDPYKDEQRLRIMKILKDLPSHERQ